ncbi:MAG: Nramp family divalent metal transporter [Pseudomonadota bacterium]
MNVLLGPGALVAAAFVGPGTVTACTLAGANFGFALVWALVFATLATIVLQDMAVRLGVGAQSGLGEALMRGDWPPALRWSVGALVFAALVIGNAAYEGGNLAGGALGLNVLVPLGDSGQMIGVIGLAGLATLLLMTGSYKQIEQILIGLVLIMSIAFLIGFVMIRPDLGALLSGFVPRIPDGATLTAIALIGTTIVPYNLFLHAAAARQKWTDASDTSQARQENWRSIGLGGIVSILILSTAASTLFSASVEVSSAADMARALEPAFGGLARGLIGVGLLAAGLTSAITAPMATAYVLNELIPPKTEAQRGQRFRITALAIIAIGVVIAVSGYRPVELILIAQAANGLLLPLVAVFLLLVMNRKAVLGAHVNRLATNLAGWSVVVLTFGLGARGVLRALGVL